MKDWLLNHASVLALSLIVPLAWKVLPALIAKVKGPINEAVKNILRKTHKYWNGHEEALEGAIDEAAKELKADIQEVDKEQEGDKPA